VLALVGVAIWASLGSDSQTCSSSATMFGQSLASIEGINCGAVSAMVLVGWGAFLAGVILVGLGLWRGSRYTRSG
jgi:hypothetical protein